MEQTFNLPLPLVRAIGDYLAGQPYREVAALLSALQTAVTAQETAHEADLAVAEPAAPGQGTP